MRNDSLLIANLPLKEVDFHSSRLHSYTWKPMIVFANEDHFTVTFGQHKVLSVQNKEDLFFSEILH